MTYLIARAVLRIKAWQAELAAAGALTLAVTWAGDALGAGAAHSLLGLALAAAMSVPSSRARLKRLLGARARRRRWVDALAGVIPPPATPTLTAYQEDPVGSRVVIRTGPSGTVTDLAKRAEQLAAWLGVHDVRLERHPHHAGLATLRALRYDPLDADPGPWPPLHAHQTDLWTPVPIGVDEDGQPVTVSLAGHNLLIGGEPGAGKSVAVSQLIAAAALDPTASLWLPDGKLVELAAWRAAATGTAGTDIHHAIDLLAQVRAGMDGRYRQLLELGKRHIQPGVGLHLVVVDELAHYCTWPDRKPRDVFTDQLRELVARGRAAGVIVVAATQKPGSDIIPTSLRDLFGYRWALRCTTGAASDTILGSGWAASGVSAHTIAARQRGVGWLLHESGVPVRLRSHHLADTAITQLAQRAAQLRDRADP